MLQQIDGKPEYCAKENRDCECTGNIYYGTTDVDDELDMSMDYFT